MEELNVMLADLAEEGSLDSIGAFTVALEKAEEKLAAYRLTNPGLFVLNLVAAAVSGGATQLAVETHRDYACFRFDPALSYSDSQLEDLFGYILTPSAPAHVRELALALHSARALPHSPRLLLTVAGEGRGRELRVEGSKLVLAYADPDRPFPKGVVFRVDFQQASGWEDFLMGRADRTQEVLRHLFHFCRFAPLRLTSNGQAKNTVARLGGKEIFAWRKLVGEQALNLAEPRGEYPPSEDAAGWSLPSTVLLGLGTPKAAAATGLILVSRGVAFKRPHALLGFPLACAVVTADHLEKNLSQSDLVEDTAYDLLIQSLQVEVQSLVFDVCANPPQWSSPAQSAAFLRALDPLYPEDGSVPIPLEIEMLRRRETTEDHCRDPDQQAGQMSFWRSLMVEAPEKAALYGEDLAAAVSRQAARRLSLAQWQEAAAYLSDLYELQGRASDGYLAVILMLAGRSHEAETILAPDCPGNSHLLRALLGWEVPTEDEPMALFLRFQRCLDEDDFESADALATNLERQRGGTPVLYLWLGWYHLFRQRPSRALALWERTLKGVHVEEKERWADLLWPELSGKVSFLEQVGWQARRGFESLQFSLGSAKVSTAQVKLLHPTRWAKAVWEARKQKDKGLASQLFVESYLAAMLNPAGQTLEPLDSPALPLALFRAPNARR